MMVCKNGRRVVCLLAVWLVVGCAAREHLVRGDGFLKQGRHADAIMEYERVLEGAPDNEEAQQGIRKARRLAVRIELKKANRNLKQGDYARALRGALRARRMPLDLEDVDLVQKIDSTIASTAKAAEKRVREFIGRKHYIPAVELADSIVQASPGEKAREFWAEDIRKQAVAYYGVEGKKLRAKRPGSAAIQLALRKRALGEQVKRGAMASLWDRFASPVCFAAPMVEISDASRQLGEVGASLQGRLVGALKGFQERCGVGKRPLGLKIQFSEVDVVDTTDTRVAAQALPGVRVKTEEVYYEEVPYTEMVEVKEFETRVEKQEKRDCAPRPGKPRGCRTWVEDVEVKVPVIRKKEVQKIRRIERKRPITNLPDAKVVKYDVTTVTRQITYGGTIEIKGVSFAPSRFTVSHESVDSSHAEVDSRGVFIKADALQVESLAEVQKRAGTKLFLSIKEVLGRAVTEWTHEMRSGARQNSADGEFAAAEEGYLALVALGATPGQELEEFFNKRYGLGIHDVLDTVSPAVGREIVVSRKAGKLKGDGRRFPRRGIPTRVKAKAPARAVKVPVKAPVPAAGAAEAVAAVPEISEEDAVAPIEFEGSDEEIEDFSDLVEASLEGGSLKTGEKKASGKNKNKKKSPPKSTKKAPSAKAEGAGSID